MFGAKKADSIKTELVVADTEDLIPPIMPAKAKGSFSSDITRHLSFKTLEDSSKR